MANETQPIVPATGTEPAMGGTVTAPQTPPIETPGVTPAVDAADPKALQAIVAELEKKLSNKTQEAERLHKKVQATEDAEKTEAQKLKERAENAEREALVLKQTIQRQEIAAKVGLPSAFANRIIGVTPEEMEADAKAMLATMPKQAPQVGPTSPTGGTLQTTEAQRRKRVWSVGVDPDAAMRGMRPD